MRLAVAVAVAVAVLASLVAVAPARAAECLSYEGRVRLAGVLESETFPGPPEYESIAGGDRPETVWLLRLDAPVCVAQGKADPSLNEAEADVSRIQLVLTVRQYRDNVGLLGARVSLSGTLIHSHTGHHRTTVLLDAVRFGP